MNDFERVASQREQWRRYKRELDAAVELLHCPDCLHEYLPQPDTPDDTNPIYCLSCLVEGKVSVMGEIEGFDQPMWYDVYIDQVINDRQKKPPHGG